MWWYGAPAGADVADPAMWRACNPASWLRDGRVLAAEYARLRSRGAVAEWRIYHLDQFVEELEAWMPTDAWEACAGDPVFDARLPVHACVRIAHDHRSAAVAIAQRQGERVALRVRAFPDVPLPEGEYVEADIIEDHIRSLHARYRAPVSAEVIYRPGGPVHHRRRPGPEFLHHGAFFEPSRQRLVKQGIVMLDFPSTAERLGPAAAALMQQVTARTLVHDGDGELGRQMARVVARTAPKGWSVASGTGEPVMAAIAAMLAVQRALTAPRVRINRTSGL